MTRKVALAGACIALGVVAFGGMAHADPNIAITGPADGAQVLNLPAQCVTISEQPYCADPGLRTDIVTGTSANAVNVEVEMVGTTTGGVAFGDATLNGDGTWSFSPPLLPPDTYTITATAWDADSVTAEDSVTVDLL